MVKGQKPKSEQDRVVKLCIIFQAIKKMGIKKLKYSQFRKACDEVDRLHMVVTV